MWCMVSSRSCSSVSRWTRTARSSGPRVRSNRRQDSSTARRAASSRRAAGGRARRSIRGREKPAAGSTLLHGARRGLGNARAQHLVAAEDLAQAGFEGGSGEAARQAHGKRHVVGRQAGIEAVEDPQPLLLERERRRTHAGRPLDGGEDEAGAQAQLLVDGCGELLDRGALEQQAQRQLDAERLAQPRRRLGGEQRVAAEGEKVVAGLDPVAAEKLGPEAGDQLLGGCARGGRTRRRGARGARRAPRRPPDPAGRPAASAPARRWGRRPARLLPSCPPARGCRAASRRWTPDSLHSTAT